MFSRRHSRCGFTLIEMLVVIGIIVLLTAIALAFMPKAESRLANQGADQLQTYIAAARARAARDNMPSGIRLVGNGPFTEFQFVQAPEPFTQSGVSFTVPAPSGSTGSTVATFSSDISGSIAVGDLIELPSTGEVHRVTAISGTSVTFASAFIGSDISALSVPAGGWRFIREPRPLMGETPLQLPRYVQVLANGSAAPASLNIPSGFSGQFDIIFSPSGQVVNASQGRIVLWVNDTNGVSQPTLLCIYTRTGGVAAHPMNTDSTLGDAYFFTTDGKSSGQ